MGWLREVSTETLGKIAGVGGMLLLGTSVFLQQKLRDQLQDSSLYQGALETLRQHPGALQLLGQPIKEGNVKIDYRDNFCDGKNAKYKIPVLGPKNQGYYYFWAKRSDNEFVVTRGELEILDDKTKRLVIVKEKEENKVEAVATVTEEKKQKTS